MRKPRSCTLHLQSTAACKIVFHLFLLIPPKLWSYSIKGYQLTHGVYIQVTVLGYCSPRRLNTKKPGLHPLPPISNIYYPNSLKKYVANVTAISPPSH